MKQINDPSYPEELRRSYMYDSPEVFNDKVGKYNRLVKEELTKFETWVNTEAPKELKDAYAKGGLVGYAQKYSGYVQGQNTGQQMVDQFYGEELKRNWPGLYRVYTRTNREEFQKLSDEFTKDKPDADVLAKYLTKEQQAVYNDPNLSAGDKFSIIEDSGLFPPGSIRMSGKTGDKPEISWGQDYSQRLLSANPKEYVLLTAEMLVPFVYTARNWKNLAGWERGLYLTLDAVSVMPFITEAASAARTVSTVGRMARAQAIMLALGREGLNQIRAPITMIAHPVETAKGIYRSGRSVVELLSDTKRLSKFVVTTANNIPFLDASYFSSEKKALQAQEKIYREALKSKKVVINFDGIKVTVPRSPLMRELGGGMATVGPDIEKLAESAKVKYKPGKPANEQGLFFGTEAAIDLTQADAFGKGGGTGVPKKAVQAVRDISKYRVEELVRVDKMPVRPLDFANAKNVPPRLARDIQNYTRRADGVLYGSMNEYTKIKKAARPNDLDLIFRNQNQAIDDIIRLARNRGYEARRAPHAVEILKDGKWTQVADVNNFANHKAQIPEGLSHSVLTRIDGIRTETMGEQYLRQSFGAISKTAKAPQRAERLNNAAKEVRKMLKEAGTTKRKPGMYITSEELQPSGKLFQGDKIELEAIKPAGEAIKKPIQKLWWRDNAGERAELYLADKQLSPLQIAKLKAETLSEIVKAPFKQPIKITDADGKQIIVQTKVTGRIPGISGARTATTARAAARLSTSPSRIFAAEPDAVIRRMNESMERIEIPEEIRRSVIIRVKEAIRVKGVRNLTDADIEEAAREATAKRVVDKLEANRLADEIERIGDDTLARVLRTNERSKWRDEEPSRGKGDRPAEFPRGLGNTEAPPRTPKPPKVDIPNRPRVPEQKPPRVPKPPRTPEQGRTPPDRPFPPRINPPRIPPPPRDFPLRGPDPPPRGPDPPPRGPDPPPREPPPPPPPPRPPDEPKVGKGKSDKKKREIIRKAKGFTTYNMGKLHDKDVWHVKLDTGERLVVLGKPPEGAGVFADGPGSADKTAQRVGKLKDFRTYSVQHGAVTSVVRPQGSRKGATASFAQSSGIKSEKFGRMYRHNINGTTGYSRKPIKRRRK